MTQNSNFEGLPEMIRKLTESPEIAEIIKNAGITGEQPSTPMQKPKNENAVLPDDIMDKLPMVIAALQNSGIMSSSSSAAPKEEPKAQQTSNQMPDMNEIAAKLPQVMTALSAMGITSTDNHKPRSEDRNRKALLNALRPYMSDRKRDAIDTMLGMGSLAEIMKMLMGGDN
jgi:hypothetical protein